MRVDAILVSPLGREGEESAQTTFFHGRSRINTRDLRCNLAITDAEPIVMMVFEKRRTQIHRGTGFSKVVRDAGEHGPADIFLNPFQYFLVALMPTIDDDSCPLGFDSETGKRHEPPLQSPK